MAKEIELKNGGCVIVDDEDYPALSQYQWFRAGRDKRYVIRMDEDGKKWILIARVVSGAQKGQYIAWRNGNSLDCRKENIFVGTPSQAKNVARGGDGIHFQKETRADRRTTRAERILARRIERFNAQVRVAGPDECWEWQGHTILTGYGTSSWGTRPNEYTHRIAWMLANKRPVPEGMVIRHSCDNPKCCNPAHLLIGTHADNMADRRIRNRPRRPGMRGLGNQIVAMRREGATYAEIQDALKCSFFCIATHLRKAGMTRGARNG